MTAGAVASVGAATLALATGAAMVGAGTAEAAAMPAIGTAPPPVITTGCFGSPLMLPCSEMSLSKSKPYTT